MIVSLMEKLVQLLSTNKYQGQPERLIWKVDLNSRDLLIFQEFLLPNGQNSWNNNRLIYFQ